MTKSALDLAEKLRIEADLHNQGGYEWDGTADFMLEVADALLRLSSERDEMVERCIEICDRAWLDDRPEASSTERALTLCSNETVEQIKAGIRSLSKPQEGGER